MSIKVELKGLPKALKGFEKYNLKKRKQVKELIQITALNIETQAKKNVHVDTGRLRSSIETLYKALDGLGVEVGTDVVYAIFEEFKPNNHPFLGPAAENERPKYLKELKKILKDVK